MVAELLVVGVLLVGVEELVVGVELDVDEELLEDELEVVEVVLRVLAVRQSAAASCPTVIAP
ncbi:MAG: hypothetical protein JO156_03805 [Solirubrobacterales bacterium]|nr:hypothetical protein [Solirubrobacterales bacterium]